MPALHLQWASVGLVWMFWVLSPSTETTALPSPFWCPDLLGACYETSLVLVIRVLLKWSLLCTVFINATSVYDPAACLKLRAGAICNSLSQVCGPQPPCTGCPCSILDQSYGWCCDLSRGHEKKTSLETEWGHFGAGGKKEMEYSHWCAQLSSESLSQRIFPGRITGE